MKVQSGNSDTFMIAPGMVCFDVLVQVETKLEPITHQGLQLEVVLNLEDPSVELEQNDVIVLSSIDTPEKLRIPLVSMIPRPQLVVPPSISFGSVVADGRVNSRSVEIVNHGSLAAQYTVSIRLFLLLFLV